MQRNQCILLSSDSSVLFLIGCQGYDCIRGWWIWCGYLEISKKSSTWLATNQGYCYVYCKQDREYPFMRIWNEFNSCSAVFITLQIRKIFINFIQRARAAGNHKESAKELKKMIAFNTLVVTELVNGIKEESDDESTEEPGKEGGTNWRWRMGFSSDT